jgi:hypothetical protein
MFWERLERKCGATFRDTNSPEFASGSGQPDTRICLGCASTGTSFLGEFFQNLRESLFLIVKKR